MTPTRIFLAGHRGMAGSAILRALAARGGAQVLTRPRAELDLTDRAAVRGFMQAERPDLVILAAAKVGGILANDRFPAEFLHDNLAIALNVIAEAQAAGVPRLLNLGSSCIYPRDAAQPIREEALLTGPLEPTNEPYALAKIAALKLCDSCNRQYGTDYRSLMPANLYGPGDNFHPETAHVLPALIRRFHAAAEAGAGAVTIWGTGTPRREFLHVDDLAAAALFVLDLPAAAWRAAAGPGGHLNVGTGTDIAIRDLAGLVAGATGFRGRIATDPSRPDGTPRKLMDVSRLAALGWRARIGLEAGLAGTYEWFLNNRGRLRG